MINNDTLINAGYSLDDSRIGTKTIHHEFYRETITISFHGGEYLITTIKNEFISESELLKRLKK